MAYMDVDEDPLGVDSFSTDVNLDLDDGSSGDFGVVNDFVERMNMINKG